MSPKDKAFEVLAANIIKGLEKRNMVGHYFNNSKELCEYIKNDIPKGALISWGGTASFAESGVQDVIKSGDYNVLDRADAKNEDELKEVYRKAYSADYYFMSTNAITMDGELVNVDGRGNRVAMLIQGPEHVYIIAGRNKVTKNMDEAMSRIRNIAAPPNTIRLGLNTPCAKNGKCFDCNSDDCICCQIVITRHNRAKDRIHVFLVNEELGF